MKEIMNQKWNKLLTSSAEGFRQVLFSGDGNAEFFLAINAEQKRCVVLYIPETLWSSFIGFQDNTYENISISFVLREGRGWISITLKNDDLLEFFNDLIISLWDKIEEISDPELYSREFVKAYWKWAGFFDRNNLQRLSIEEIMGLFAELTFLRTLIEESSRDINTLLDSWTGPFRNEKDFVLPERIIEIKAHGSSSYSIWISSLNQLTEINGKDIWLGLIELVSDRNGIALTELINSITALIKESGSDTQKLYERLFEMGITSENLHLYNAPKFIAQPFRFYDTTIEGFPKLTRKTIVNEKIEDVRYNIRITSLNLFEKSLNIKEL